MPSRASSRGPRSTATPARWWCVFVADPQRRVYVRRIDVAGNTRTRDEVIRREFRQFESSWYDGAKIKLSRDRVDRLGYFKEVSVDTDEVPGIARPGRPDGQRSRRSPPATCSIGAGYSSAEKLTLTASIKQENVFGSGNYLGLEHQHQQEQPHAGRQHASTRTSRSTASRGPSTCTTATSSPLNSLRRQLPAHHPGRVGALRRAVHRVRHGVLRPGLRADADRRRHLPAQQLLPVPRAVRSDQQFLPADGGLVARRARQRPRSRPTAATSASTSRSARWATCSTPRRTCSTSSTWRCPTA